MQSRTCWQGPLTHARSAVAAYCLVTVYSNRQPSRMYTYPQPFCPQRFKLPPHSSGPPPIPIVVMYGLQRRERRAACGCCRDSRPSFRAGPFPALALWSSSRGGGRRRMGGRPELSWMLPTLCAQRFSHQREAPLGQGEAVRAVQAVQAGEAGSRLPGC